MREILFRGQTRKRGEKVRMNGEKLPGKWVYGGVLQGNGDHSIIYGKEADETPIDKHVVHSDTLGQYTGLHDKNGERIFEGDIVLAPMMLHTGEVKNEIGVVEYLKGAFSVNWINDKGRHFAGYLRDLVIIGNIHDNLELLKPESSKIERK